MMHIKLFIRIFKDKGYIETIFINLQNDKTIDLFVIAVKNELNKL
jgi:hypothetical protein